MRSTNTIALALATSLAAMPAAAQQTIRAGTPVSGRLDAADPTLDDGSHYEIWNYTGRAGERLTITLRSNDFDAYLAFGKTAGADCAEACETDDDGAGGTDARVVVTLRENGVYQIRANTLSEGETGSYTLSVESGAAPPPPAPSGRISAGDTRSGTLADSDARADDDSFYDLWTFSGRPGQRITITLRSDAFDAYLGWGRMANGEWEEIDSDDDGAGGTNARLEVTVGDAGSYAIRANSLSEGETGDYTLTVEEGGSGGVDSGDEHDHGMEGEEEDEAIDLGRAQAISAGAAATGRLDAGDPTLGDGSHYDAYVYTGRAGERLTITMRSDDFDTFLSVGRAEGGRFVSLESNDDGEDGTNSELEITLPADGRYVIRANSLAGGSTGAYTLSVRSSR